MIDDDNKLIDDKGQKRVKPSSNIDLQLMTTDSVWGDNAISKTVRDRLAMEGVKITFKKGEVKETANGGYIKFEEDTEVNADANYWELLDIYTRDLRLGNISKKDGEMDYCQHMLDLAGDLLQEGYKGAFAIAMRKVATVLELSQSKGGFLRNKFNTLTYEQYTEEREPPKKGLLGMKKKEGFSR